MKPQLLKRMLDLLLLRLFERVGHVAEVSTRIGQRFVKPKAEEIVAEIVVVRDIFLRALKRPQLGRATPFARRMFRA